MTEPLKVVAPARFYFQKISPQSTSNVCCFFSLILFFYFIIISFIYLYILFKYSRWVLCANHMEPVKGFLGRYLRRKLVEAEVHMGTRNNDLNKIIDWIPKVWQHLNKFLETHSSSDVTIGKKLRMHYIIN